MTATVTFTLPRSFNPAEFLDTPRLAMRADDARWLVSTIVCKTANRDTDRWGCVRLHSKIMRRIMYEPTMGDVIEALERGAIETYGYAAGVKSKGFRLAGRYLGDRPVRVLAVDVRLVQRIQREQERMEAEQRREWLPIHHLLNAEQRQLTIDPAADELVSVLPYHCRLCQSVLVDRLQRRQLSFSVSTTGRVFNSIT
jgi:hypothetical protein